MRRRRGGRLWPTPQQCHRGTNPPCRRLECPQPPAEWHTSALATASLLPAAERDRSTFSRRAAVLIPDQNIARRQGSRSPDPHRQRSYAAAREGPYTDRLTTSRRDPTGRYGGRLLEHREAAFRACADERAQPSR